MRASGSYWGLHRGWLFGIASGKFSHYFLQNICWAFGSGHRTLIGHDYIMGISNDIPISEELVHRLHNPGIFYWNQVISTWNGNFPIWCMTNEMVLVHNLAGEWARIWSELQRAGVRREHGGDKITWRGKMKSNCVVVVDIYHTLCLRGSLSVEVCEFYKFWKTKVPIKIIVFVWLVWKSKNLTWENL